MHKINLIKILTRKKVKAEETISFIYINESFIFNHFTKICQTNNNIFDYNYVFSKKRIVYEIIISLMFE